MQTARGASLNSGGDTHTTRSSYVRLFFVVALAILVIDQITKALAVAYLDDRGPVTIIPHVFSLSFTRNAGAAFSMATGLTVVFTAIAVVVCVFVLRAASRLRDRGWAIGLGLLLGGAVGNLSDRIFREPSIFKGHVVDFLYIHHYPVFNVADVALTFAAIVIFWRTWRGIGIDGKR